MTEDRRRELAAAILSETVAFLAASHGLTMNEVVRELRNPLSKARAQFMGLVDTAAQTVCEF